MQEMNERYNYPWSQEADIYSQNSRPCRIELVQPKQLDELIGRLEVHSDRNLGADYLASEGLLPTFEHQVGGRTSVFFSRVFRVRERDAVIAYVPGTTGELVARTFYLSNSQGLWRYLPRVSSDWYDKGHNEQSLQMPAQFQSTLAAISEVGVRRAKPFSPQNAFLCTTRIAEGLKTYLAATDERAQRLKGNFYDSIDMIPPQELQFYDHSESIDLSRGARPKDSWIQDTSQYGPLLMEVFPSRDGRFKYTLARDPNGGKFVAGGETSELYLNAVGINRAWLDVGQLATPAKEYASQSGGYGTGFGTYVDMFQNYLSRVPLIREYEFSLRQRKVRSISRGPYQEISRAESFQEFYEALRQKGEVPSSAGPLDSSLVIDIIEDIRSDRGDTWEIPRTGGVRQRVIDLLRLEKAEKLRRRSS